jgi:hypothetical protein
MHKVYRHKLESAETPINTTDELVDLCEQSPVLLQVLSRGHGELHKDNLSDPFWVLSEEELEGMELLRNALDRIKPIDADDDFHAVKALLKGSDTLLNGLFLQVLWVQRIPISLTQARTEQKKMRALVNEVGSIPIGKVPTCASRPSNSTPLAMMGSEIMREHEERKLRP